MNGSLVSLVASVGLLVAPGPKDRPSMDIRINDHPIRLTIDTGTETLVLFSYAADRIGLAYQKPQRPPDPNRLRPGLSLVYPSDRCRVGFGNSETQTRLLIGEIPAGLRLSGFDGVMGWANMAKNILHIDWGQKVFEPVPQVPEAARQWPAFDLYSPPGQSVLVVQVSESSEPLKAVYIDTGDPGGVHVASALWREILSRRPTLSTAIEGLYTPGVGYRSSMVCWLPLLKLGSIELHDVPVSEAPKAFQQWPGYQATLGLYGLTRLELVVDGRTRRVYVRARQDYSKKHDYNRGGVVFLPADEQSSDLLATVLDQGPAYEAGVRNGDRLLRVNGRDVTGWRTDPNGWMSDASSTFDKPAGTKVTLTIMRDNQPREVTVVLKEMLPVEATPPAPEKDQVNQSRQETPSAEMSAQSPNLFRE